jgi:hypothetical protein
MLEVISIDPKDHQDAEAILANPSHGPNMATTQILADPMGILTPLQWKVAAEYGRRRWVEARCEKEKESAEKHLAAMRAASTPQERLDAVWAFVSALSGLLAVAQLKRPTTRRTLTLLREMLEAQGRPDLHEEALAVFGSAQMSRDDVQAMLDRSVAAFDRSVEVYKTPTPYRFTIRAHLRPYLSEATQEMVNEGNHREAVFWIAALAGESYLVLQNDSPEDEKPRFAAQLQAMHAALGYADSSDEEWAERLVVCQAAFGRLSDRGECCTLMVGYSFFSLIRASAVVKRHSTVAFALLRSETQASVSIANLSWSGIRWSKHWLLSTDNSISAMFSQLPCLGV